MHKAIIDYLLKAHQGTTPRETLEMYEVQLYRLPLKELAERFLAVVRLQGC